MFSEKTFRLYTSYMRERALELRDIGNEIEKNPNSIQSYTDIGALRMLNTMMIPPEYGGEPVIKIEGKNLYGLSCLERVIAMEQLAYGDVGVLLASPGPSLSGIIIEDFANEEHKEKFYGSFLKEPTWSFFAISEPDRGSDASSISTKIKKGPDNTFFLNGEKYFIGNGNRAKFGLVFARKENSVLGIEIIFIDTDTKGFSSYPLNSLGVKGAELSCIKFENCQFEEKQIVGRQITPIKRGLWGAIKTFNQMRPGVSSLALGVAQAAFDYVVQERKHFNELEKSILEEIEAQIQMTRSLIYKAAREIDVNNSKGYLASISKIQAARLAEKVTSQALVFMGVGSMFEHPLLNKWYRDARAFEFMEGTTNIQKLNIAQAYINGRMSYV